MVVVEEAPALVLYPVNLSVKILATMNFHEIIGKVVVLAKEDEYLLHLHINQIVPNQLGHCTVWKKRHQKKTAQMQNIMHPLQTCQVIFTPVAWIQYHHHHNQMTIRF